MPGFFPQMTVYLLGKHKDNHASHLHFVNNFCFHLKSPDLWNTFPETASLQQH